MNAKSGRKLRQMIAGERDLHFSLSFSGLDRNVAKAIADKALEEGLSVFYDKYRQSELWGEDESVYHGIYGSRSHFVVPLVSKNYLRSDNGSFEFDIARREAKSRTYRYILPVRLDNSLLCGLRDSTGYLSIEEHDASSIVQVIKEKLEKVIHAEMSPTKTEIRVAHADERLTLGLVVTASLPREFRFYQALFPKLDWTTLLVKLELDGLVQDADGLPKATAAAKRAIPESSDEYKMLVENWIAVLEPLQHYMDIAPSLALHYFATKRANDAAKLLAEVAMGVDLGWWNSIYVSAFDAIVERKVSTLEPDVQLAVLNAHGICLGHSGRYDDALSSYSKLLRLANKRSDDYWVGQALINSGVAHFHAGTIEKAIKKYEQACEHGRKCNDWRLVGRSLGNQAETVRTFDVAKARELLAQSVRAKKRGRDAEGLTAALMQQGNLEATEGRPKQAIPFFSKCEKQCCDTGNAYLQSLALHNLGNAHAELKRTKMAVRYFRRSVEVAETCGFDYPLSLASLGLGMVLFSLQRLPEANEAFSKLLDVSQRIGDVENQMCALHALAVGAVLTANNESAKPHFVKAIRFARKHNLAEWYARCLCDRTRSVQQGELGPVDIKAVSAIAQRYERNGEHVNASQIWLQVARATFAASGDREATESCYRSAADSLLSHNNWDPYHILALFEFADWQWSIGHFSDSLATVESAEVVAKRAKCSEEEAIAADKRGVYLQHFERFKEAQLCHARSVCIARKNGLGSLLETFLNNLGEAHRQLENWSEADSCLQEAEEIALTHDVESAISIAHNRGLVKQQSGNLGEAEAVFINCRDRAKRAQLWYEYVRAWEALASLALVQGRNGLSRQRYERAIAAAKTHRILDQCSRTVLNYASLLMNDGEPKHAIRILTPYLKSIQADPDLHLFHMVVGQSFQAIGKPTEAIEHLRTAVRLSRAIGDTEKVLICSSSLAETLTDIKAYAEAREVLLEVIDLEPDLELRVFLMIQQLGVELAAEMGESQATYDKAVRIATKQNFDTALAELHFVVGEHLWKGDYESKTKSLQSLMVANGHALSHDVSEPSGSDESDDSMAGEIMGRTILLLTHPQTATAQGEFNSLVQDTETWAKANMKSRRSRDFMLSPLRMAAKLLPLNKTPVKMAKELDRLIAAEGSI